MARPYSSKLVLFSDSSLFILLWASARFACAANPEEDRIVAAIDVRDGVAVGSGWVAGATGRPFEEALAGLQAAGISTFAVTSIARDGLEQGPDWQLLERAAAVVGADRIIASGGVTTTSDVSGLSARGFGGAILGRALYEATLSLADALAVAR